MIPGNPMGMPILKKMVHSPPPSMRAASKNDFGMDSKNFSMIYTGKVENIPGSITARWVSSIPNRSRTR